MQIIIDSVYDFWWVSSCINKQTTDGRKEGNYEQSGCSKGTFLGVAHVLNSANEKWLCGYHDSNPYLLYVKWREATEMVLALCEQ